MTSTHDPSGPPPQQSARPAHGHRAHEHGWRVTRIGGVWFGLSLSAIVLLFLLIFILENDQKVDISYLGAHGHLPLGVALLLAAIAGALLTAIPASGRIMQLRRVARRQQLTGSAAQSATPAPGPRPGNQA